MEAATDRKFEKMTEVQQNLILEFAGIMNIDDVDTSIFFLEMANFNLNVSLLFFFHQNN